MHKPNLIVKLSPWRSGVERRGKYGFEMDVHGFYESLIKTGAEDWSEITLKFKFFVCR